MQFRGFNFKNFYGGAFPLGLPLYGQKAMYLHVMGDIFGVTPGSKLNDNSTLNDNCKMQFVLFTCETKLGT